VLCVVSDFILNHKKEIFYFQFIVFILAILITNFLRTAGPAEASVAAHCSHCPAFAAWDAPQMNSSQQLQNQNNHKTKQKLRQQENEK